jgi:hypothetical protein
LTCVDGATCTVPASPELALGRDLFDVVESEVIRDLGGALTYNLSLSAKPSSMVYVTVTSEIRQASCYGHPIKMNLNQSMFAFTPQEYNIPQTVRLEVQRLNESVYEGTFSASLRHSISTEDEDFQSGALRLLLVCPRPYQDPVLTISFLHSFRTAFLRPVSVTLQDDSPCPKNSQKYEDENRVRKCGWGALLSPFDLLSIFLQRRCPHTHSHNNLHFLIGSTKTPPYFHPAGRTHVRLSLCSATDPSPPYSFRCMEKFFIKVSFDIRKARCCISF